MIAINNSSCTSFPAGVEQVVIPCVKAFIKKKGGSTIFRLTGMYGKMQVY